MRLTINLDKDLYAVAKSLAREEDSSLSTAVNVLLRRALERPATIPAAGGRKRRSPVGRAGLPQVRCERAFSSDDVYRLDSETA